MRKAYLIGEPDTKMSVHESPKPGIVRLEILGAAAELPRDEFGELCNLLYYIQYAAEVQTSPTTTLTDANPDDIPF